MNTGIVLAVLCLVFSGLNDFIFKKFTSTKAPSTGIYVAMIGLYWFVFQIIFYYFTDSLYGFNFQPLLYSLIPGLFLLFSNILFIESMGVLNTSLASTVYRLNSVPAVILSLLFLNDRLAPAGVLGFVLSTAAVILLFEKKERSVTGKYYLFLILCISASFLRAAFAFSSKYLMVWGIENRVINTVSSLLWIAGGIIYALIRDKKVSIKSINFRYSLLSGFFIFLVAVLLFNAIDRGNLSIIIPITNMGFLIAYLLAIVSGIEKVTVKKIAALILAASAVILLSIK